MRKNKLFISCILIVLCLSGCGKQIPEKRVFKANSVQHFRINMMKNIKEIQLEKTILIKNISVNL